MKVIKFGGTSVGSARRIQKVGNLISTRGKNIVVLSAMSGTTNSLIQISDALRVGDIRKATSLKRDLQQKYVDVVAELFTKKAYADKANHIVDKLFSDIDNAIDSPYDSHTEKKIVACGELLSTNLMTEHLHEQGLNAVLLPALDFMRTDSNGEPDQLHIRHRLIPMLESHPEADLYITQGFICRNHRGEINNLLRGGSDYSASLIGAAIDAEEVEIWTDIDGMHNNDPRFVENTHPVHNLHFEEAAELAYFGAKILHPTCILPAKNRNIAVRLLNTLQPEAEGTLINNNLIRERITAVAAKDNITAIKIKSSRMLLAYGFLKKVFEIFEKYHTAIDMITTSEVGVSVTIDNESNLPLILSELEALGQVTVDRDMVIVCVVGDLDWHNRGFEARALDAVAEVPVRMISYGGSNYNISFLIKSEDKLRVLRLLSERLFNQ